MDPNDVGIGLLNVFPERFISMRALRNPNLEGRGLEKMLCCILQVVRQAQVSNLFRKFTRKSIINYFFHVM